MIIKKIKHYIMKLFWRKSCKIEKNVVVDRASFFEGKNLVRRNSEILHTHLGYASYVGLNCFLKNAVIGRYTCIANDVRTVSGTHPSKNYVSIHPAFYAKKTPIGLTYVKKDRFEEYNWLDRQKNITVLIGNDVWLGEGVRILDGVKIGDGVIAGAGALIVNDVPPYAVVGGVPAKIIRYRFSEMQREKLLKIKWWNQDNSWIQKNAHLFDDVEKFLGREM